MISMDFNQFIKMIVFIAGTLVIISCDQALDYSDSVQSSEQSFSGDVAFTVNNEPVWHFDILSAAIAEGVIRDGESFESHHREYKDVVDRLVDRVLLAQAAHTLDLMSTPEANRQLHIARRQVLARLYLDHVIENRVNEGAILDMYEEQVRLQQIDDSMRFSRIVMEDKETADSAREQILMGRSFNDVATEYSIESSWKRRTDAENFVKPNRYRTPYPEILTETSVGGVSEPFKTNEGWIILKVEERLGKAPARLDEMHSQISEFLTHTQVDIAIANLKKRAIIEYPSDPSSKDGKTQSNQNKSTE